MFIGEYGETIMMDTWRGPHTECGWIVLQHILGQVFIAKNFTTTLQAKLNLY
jgi:hypothetical protein